MIMTSLILIVLQQADFLGPDDPGLSIVKGAELLYAIAWGIMKFRE